MEGVEYLDLDVPGRRAMKAHCKNYQFSLGREKEEIDKRPISRKQWPEGVELGNTGKFGQKTWIKY